MAERTPPTEQLPIELPPIARRIAELIGLAATLRLAEVYGGVGVCIPKKATAAHALAKLIGIEAMQLLVAESLRGQWLKEWLWMPKCDDAIRAERDRRIRAEYVPGEVSAHALARKYRLTVRQIRRILAGADAADDRQGDLFQSRT